MCFTLGLSAAVGVGLARFAYALILPAMQASFAWSYAQAGALNAANSAGYLGGALLASAIIARAGPVRTLVTGSGATALSIMATGLAHDYTAILALRLVSGVTGALAFVAGSVLAAGVAAGLGPRASAAVGLFYTGPGVGVVVSGVVVPGLLGGDGSGWPAAWFGLGLCALLCTVLVALAARRVTSPGGSGARSSGTGVSLVPALLAYLCFAGGYIGYLTFAIAAVRESGADASTASWWWLALGAASIASFWVWSRLLAAADGRALGTLLMLAALAAAAPLASASAGVFLLSFVLFGGTFLVVVALTTNMVRLARPPARWPLWIGYFTVAFGFGQTAGPLLGGLAADWMGSSDGVLWVSSLLLGAGALVALAQRPAGAAA